jgi:hypothetical protein
MMASSSSETSVDVSSSIEKPGPPVSASVVAVENLGYLKAARYEVVSKVCREVAEGRKCAVGSGAIGSGSEEDRKTSADGYMEEFDVDVLAWLIVACKPSEARAVGSDAGVRDILRSYPKNSLYGIGYRTVQVSMNTVAEHDEVQLVFLATSLIATGVEAVTRKEGAMRSSKSCLPRRSSSCLPRHLSRNSIQLGRLRTSSIHNCERHARGVCRLTTSSNEDWSPELNGLGEPFLFHQTLARSSSLGRAPLSSLQFLSTIHSPTCCHASRLTASLQTDFCLVDAHPSALYSLLS